MEGKKKYVAIVLFLLIGLTLFAFANPVEEQSGDKKGNGKDTEEVTNKKDDNQGTLTTDEETNNEETNNNDQVAPVIAPVSDNGYARALAAVENAEKTLSTEDVTTARDLINLVTDNNLKNQLTERADIVKEAIDTIALVEELEKLVNESENKDEMDTARDTRTDKQVVEAVENLRNETVKTDLSDRLETLAKLLDDEEAPVITGINNNETTKEDVSLTIVDAAGNEYKVTVTVDGTEAEYADTFTADGVYKVTVVDEAFNEQTITFTVDKTAPQFDGLTSGNHYDTITVSVNDATETKITVKNMDTGVSTEVENNAVLEDEATYYITAEDAAGNKTSIWVAIDNTAPKISGVDEANPTNKNEIVYVSDKFLTSVVIDGKEYTRADFECGSNNENFTFQKKITSEGTHTVVAKDKKGNTTTTTFVIDKTAPTITGVEEGKYYTAPVTATVTDKTALVITLNGKDYVSGTEIAEDGSYTLVATDAAGNKSEVSFVVDKTAPAISVKANGSTGTNYVYQKLDFTITVTEANLDKIYYQVLTSNKPADIDTTKVEPAEYVDNGDGTYTISFTLEGINNGRKIIVKALDKAGNSKIEKTNWYHFDNVKPEIAEVIQVYEAKEGGRIKTTVKFTEDVTGLKSDWRKVSGKEYFTYFYRTKTVSLTFKDKAGNENTQEIEIDMTAPTVTGVEEGKYYNSPVTATITDKNDVVATLNGNNYVSGTEITEDGNYTLVAKDAIGNTTTVKFVIDKTLPAISVKANGNTGSKYVYQKLNFTITVTETNLDKIYYEVITNNKQNDIDTTKVQAAEYVDNGDGTYTINFTLEGLNGQRKIIVKALDKAGNSKVTKTNWYHFDNTAPVVTVTKSNNDKSTNQDVTVTLVANEEIKTPEGFTKVDGKTYTKVHSENGKFEVVVTDKAGNKTTVKYEVKRIDKVAPTATVTKSNKDGSTNKDVTVTLVANEAIYTPEGWTEVKTNKEHEFTKVYSENGKYEVVITDKAGNKTTVKFEVKRIDKVAPELTIVEKEEYTLEVHSEYVEKGYNAYDVVDKDVTNLVKKSYEFQAKDKETWEEVKNLDTSKLGTYRITYTAYDKAGNTATDSRLVKIVDTTAPVVTANVDENGNKDIYVEAGDEYVELGATVTDNYDKPWVTMKPAYINLYQVNNDGSVGPFVKRLDTTTIDTKVVGKYLVVYEEKDSNGNVSDKSLLISKRWVTVQDKTPATIVLPYTEGLNKNEMRVEAGTKVTVDDVVAKVTDNVDAETTIKPYRADLLIGSKEENTYNYDFTNGFDTKYVGRYNLYYEYIDQAGNKSTACMLLVIKDKTAPVAELDTKNSVGKNGVYSKVVIKVTDNAYLDRYVINGGPVSTITNLTTEHSRTFIGGHLKEGKNTIAVYDKAGNCSNVIEFNYDATAPTVSENNYLGSNPYRGMSFKLHDNNAVDYYVINGTKKDVTDAPWSDANYSNIERYLVNGENTLVLYDIAGNATTHTFTLDREAPVAVLDTNGSVGTDGVYSKVVIKVTDNAYLDRYEFNDGPYGSTITNLTTSHSRTFFGGHLKEGKNTIAVYDKAGNCSNVIEFNYDLTAPTVEVTTSNNGALTNSDVTATLTASEALQEIEGWTKVNDTTFTKAYSEDGTYEVTIKDKAGNTSTVNVTIAGIDKVAPVFAGVENNGVSNGPVTLTITEENLKEVKVNKKADADFLSTKSKEFTTPGIYTVVATDLAGNSTTHTFTIAITTKDELIAAMKNKSVKKITLGSDIELDSILTLRGSKTIDLNNHKIAIPEGKSINVTSTNTLTITGEGTIEYRGTNAAFEVTSGTGLTSATLNIEKDVTVTGESAVIVGSGRGIKVNIAGKLLTNSYALSINGTIKTISRTSPVFTLNNGAEIISTNGPAIYAAGYATWNVNGATIKGAASGVAIKAGKLYVNSGTIEATGPDKTPTEGWGNGVNPSGAAIQIESNTDYAGKMEINIKGGNIVSDNGVSIYEYLASNATTTSVKSIEVTGGNFTAGATKANVLVSEQFGNTIGKFITGGTFNADPSNFVAEGHTATLNNGSYTVA